MQRRHFLQSTLALPLVPQMLLGQKAYRVALIGAGWYGMSDLFRLLQVVEVEVVGICDVDQDHLEAANQRLNKRMGTQRKFPTYTDYQKMLVEAQPEIVIIATPDHWHALQAIAAIEAGAHLYLQKPVGVDVAESEAVLVAARKHNRKVQVGTQRRSTPHFIEIKENIIDTGRLGEIGHVEMCCYYHMRSTANPKIQNVPVQLDYDAWTGPAPLVPYTGLPHRRWRSRMEYSNGILGDMCVHMYDTARWLLDLGWPNSVSSSGGIYVQRDTWANTPDTQTAVFAHNGFNCVWQHRSWGPPVDPDYPWAIFIYGSKGTLKADVKHWTFIPNDKKKETLTGTVRYEREQFPEDVDEEGIEIHAAPATRGHMRDLIMAIEEDRLPVADIEQGHISSASCVLANLSMQLGRPLAYDAVKKIVVDDPEATALLARPYREGYTHPG
ncbi:MAG: Gfo/Idh/MocA family oxidoreductase [Bacteroidota bacterium]